MDKLVEYLKKLEGITKNIICIVSTKLDVIKITDSNYNGLIHVLNGEINLNKI